MHSTAGRAGRSARIFKCKAVRHATFAQCVSPESLETTTEDDFSQSKAGKVTFSRMGARNFAQGTQNSISSRCAWVNAGMTVLFAKTPLSSIGSRSRLILNTSLFNRGVRWRIETRAYTAASGRSPSELSPLQALRGWRTWGTCNRPKRVPGSSIRLRASW